MALLSLEKSLILDGIIAAKSKNCSASEGAK